MYWNRELAKISLDLMNSSLDGRKCSGRRIEIDEFDIVLCMQAHGIWACVVRAMKMRTKDEGKVESWKIARTHTLLHKFIIQHSILVLLYSQRLVLTKLWELSQLMRSSYKWAQSNSIRQHPSTQWLFLSLSDTQLFFLSFLCEENIEAVWRRWREMNQLRDNLMY